MLEAIKGYLGAILLCAVFFVFGTVAGLTIKPNESGVYLYFSWEGKEFVMGKNVPSISSIDLNKISETDSKILIIKVRNLSRDYILSKDLIALRDEHAGPFTPAELPIDVRFVDTEQFSGHLAMACPGSTVYGRTIYLRDIVSPRPEIKITADAKKHMWEVVVSVPQDFSECAQGDGGKHTVWVNRKMVKEWLDLEDVDLPYVSVTGKII